MPAPALPVRRASPVGWLHRQPTERGWLISLLLGVLARNLLANDTLNADGFYTLYAGRWVAQEGVPGDPFSFVSAGRPWIDQQWLAQWVFYRMWQAGGYSAVVLLSSALIGFAFALLARQMIRTGAPPMRAFLWCGMASIACSGNTGVRAQAWSFLLFVSVLTLGAIESERPHQTWRSPAMLLLVAFWANLHGAATLGVLLVFCSAGVQAWRGFRGGMKASALRAVAIAILSPVMMFATPYGLSILQYYRRLLGSSVLPRYFE